MSLPGRILLVEGDTLPPAPTAGQILFYAKTTGAFYTLNSSGVEAPFGGGGGGSGTVTSVGLTAGSSKVSVSGSPVTTSGSITVDVVESALDINNLSGVLTVPKGGTGLNGLGTAKQVFRTNAAVNGTEWASLAAADISGLAAVATSGSYADLTGKPTFDSLAPSQPGNNGKFLTTNGTVTSWATATGGSVTSVNLTAGSSKVSVSGGPITNSGSITVDVVETALTLNNIGGTLSIAKGGSGQTALGTSKQYLRTNTGATGTEWASLAAADMTGLATVATTGAYSNLTGIPSTFAPPIATASVLGGIKVGSGLAVDGSGVLSTSGGGLVISTATPQNLGSAVAGSTGQVSDAGHVHNFPTAPQVNAIGIPVNWNASTNSPTLASSTSPGSVNNSYVVSTAGSTTLDGISTWALNDIAFFNGSVWTKIAASYTLAGATDFTTATLATSNTTISSALSGKIATSLIGAANGVAGLDNTGKVPSSQLPASGGGVTIDMVSGNSFLITGVGSTSATISAVGTSSSLGTVGTATARTTSLANLGYNNRVGYVSAAAINSNAYVATSSSIALTNAPDTNPFYPPQRTRVVFSVTDSLTGCRTGAGYINGTPSATIEASANANTLWFAADSTDTQLSFMYNGASGTATKVALNGGTGFPANTNGADIYDCYIEFLGGTTRTVNYVIINKATGVKATGTVTAATIPAAYLPLRSAIYRSTVANTTAASVDMIMIAGGGYAQMGVVS